MMTEGNGNGKLTEKIENMILKYEELEKVVKQVSQEIHEIKEQVEVKNDIKDFNESKYYNNTIRGNAKPTKEMIIDNKLEPCYQTDSPFPHLYHTFDPQLNNITDMLMYIIKNCCCKDKHEQKEKYPIIHPKILDEKDRQIKDLEEHIRELEEHRCITILDLKKYFGNRFNEDKKPIEYIEDQPRPSYRGRKPLWPQII
uniref:Uncharacterized protein n=1 Tax=Blueberry red ringspot virus TaxID=172220 RepID=A0A6H1NQ75_9VIRU|nr:hypothetical protein [Blueberry red ringspot virus]